MVHLSERLAAVGLAAVCIWLLYSGGTYKRLEAAALRRAEALRMRNVTVEQTGNTEPAAAGAGVPAPTFAPATAVPLPEISLPPEPEDEDAERSVMQLEEEILETTIVGGLSIKNETDYQVDAASILLDGTKLTLPSGLPQILIIHTHSSEAYTPAGLDRYSPSDSFRTEDTEFNIIRVGDELAKVLTAAGLNVIHDRGVYDYPSYTGSYNRSAAAIEEQLKEHPSIAMVIDVHRDALGSDGVVYKTMAEEDGVCASQLMLLVGSDASGLAHPQWRENLSAALYLQQAVDERYPTLLRPVTLVRQRYNQHLTSGSMILEVGSSGNTLQEALAGARLFGSAAAPALLSLVQQVDIIQ